MSYQRDFEQRLKVGIVGVGSHAYRNLLPAMNFLPVSLQAVCDRNGRLAQVTAAQYGAKAGQRLRGEQLRALLALLVLAVALRLGFDLFVKPQSIYSLATPGF